MYLVSSRLLVGPFFSPCNLFWCIWAHFVHLTHACSHFSKHIPSKLTYCSSWKESSWFGVFFPHLALEPEPSAMVLCGVIQAPFSFPGFTFGNYPFSSTTVSIESISERYDIHIIIFQEEDIYMNIDLCFWNNFTSEIISLSWPCSHSGHILRELMCTNETQYILAICHVTDGDYLNILQNSQTQLLFTHSETLYFLLTCWILRGSNHYSFCVEKNQDCCLKKTLMR